MIIFTCLDYVRILFGEKIYNMKRITIRKDLMSKSDYSKKYFINRVTLDKKIDEGEIPVERIGKTDYIKLETK